MEPVKIAICDDDGILRDMLRREIEKYCAENQISCEITCYGSGEEILHGKKVPDILFLDIRMSGINGMETARALRSRYRDIILIFVTGVSEYVYEAFDVGAFHYLVKPFSKEKLREVLERALRQQEEMRNNAAMRLIVQGGAAQTEQDSETSMTERADRETRSAAMPDGQAERDGVAAVQGGKSTEQTKKCQAIVVKRGGISTRVLFADIIYAEVFNRKVMLHTVNGDIEYYGKLTELSEQAGEDFYRTHRAYLVNFKYVERYNASVIWLARGTALVSKKQFAGFVRQYLQYINWKGAGGWTE